MKTTKFLSVLSLALIFAGITAGSSGKVEALSPKNSQNTGITYDVIIHRDYYITTPCNIYVIQVVDENGRLVAPAQIFAPGIDKYSFIENISTAGHMYPRRIAMLVEVIPPQQPDCASPPLIALPDVKMGPFYVGQTYFFNLYVHI